MNDNTHLTADRRGDLQPLRCTDESEWIAASADAVAAALRAALDQQPRVSLLLSGGSTPAPVYRALATRSLPWDRIDVGLVDERWLPPTDNASNARLVRESLLHDQAAGANFVPLAQLGLGLQESVAAGNQHPATNAILVLGMGPDGHTASLFPGMRGLDDALESGASYVEVDAEGCPGAGAWRHRISLTPTGMSAASARFLLIRGDSKLALFERALAGEDRRELPVRVVFDLPGPRLQTFWCP